MKTDHCLAARFTNGKLDEEAMHARSELARPVCRVHGRRAGRDGAAEVSPTAMPSSSKEFNHAA